MRDMAVMLAEPVQLTAQQEKYATPDPYHPLEGEDLRVLFVKNLTVVHDSCALLPGRIGIMPLRERYI